MAIAIKTINKHYMSYRKVEFDYGYVVHADCNDYLDLLDDECIDLVITDPPYEKKYFYTYQILANKCPRVMKVGASLLTIVGHYQIPQVIEELNKNLKYRWIVCLNQWKGPHARMLMGIEVCWKPLLWYVKKKFGRGPGFTSDMVHTVRSKNFHKWEQDISYVEYFIERLTDENDLVIDPFFGSGTVGVVCERMKRRWIGIEIDEKAFDTSVKRIERSK